MSLDNALKAGALLFPRHDEHFHFRAISKSARPTCDATPLTPPLPAVTSAAAPLPPHLSHHLSTSPDPSSHPPSQACCRHPCPPNRLSPPSSGTLCNTSVMVSLSLGVSYPAFPPWSGSPVAPLWVTSTPSPAPALPSPPSPLSPFPAPSRLGSSGPATGQLAWSP